jgi:N-acetylmuramoyl-L-alanine amidase
MNRALAIAFAFCMPSLFAAAAKMERFSVSGKEYVRLDRWARANSFEWKWLSKNEVQVSSRSIRMQFTTDSKRMVLNGINVLLSEPVRNQNGVPCIANIDVTTAINPLLFPPKNRPRNIIKSICIDPGHGGKDTGYLVGRDLEKTYTLLLAKELGEQLRQAGYSVSFTRTTDTFVDLPVRPELARQHGADLFISLHFNSAGHPSSEIRGVEVYCMTPQRASSTNARGEAGNSGAFTGNLNNAKNMLLAYQIQKTVTQGAGLEDRGVKRARFAVLRGADMPAVLIEGGFLSNPSEARKIYSTAWRKQMAAAIASGISNYRKLVEP